MASSLHVLVDRNEPFRGPAPVAEPILGCLTCREPMSKDNIAIRGAEAVEELGD